MKKEWQYLLNPFFTVTQSSFRKALRISIFHDSALNAAKADAFILALYNTFHPLHLNYQNAYNTWLSQGGVQQGSTLGVEQLLDQLRNTKIRTWDIAIQNVYAQGTPQYKALLPNRRKPFQTGSQMDKLSAVKALSQAIGVTAALAATKTDVDNYYTALSTAIGNQKGNISSTSSNSDAVEKARQAMCVAQYANMGALMQKYAANPSEVARFFDLNAIRTSQQDVYTGHVKPGARALVMNHTFLPGDDLLLVNDGVANLEFYLGASKDALPEPGQTWIAVAAGKQLQVEAAQLGNLSNAYLIVHNLDEVNEGDYEVDLL